jgi:hypothetical protein
MKPEPDWAYWGNMGQVKLLNAVKLSLGICPDRGTENNLEIWELYDIDARLRMAQSHAFETLTVSHLNQLSGPEDWSVTLAEFRRWGESLPYPIEFAAGYPKLPAAASQASGPPRSEALPGEEKTLITRQRNNLLRIIGALAKHSQIDIAEGGRGAVQIEKAVQLAGYAGPKEKAIREILKDVRAVT